MSLFENMGSNIHHVRAQTKPLSGDRNVRWGHQTQDKIQIPIAPPMYEMSNTGNNHEVNSQFQNVALYHMNVTRIGYDHQYVALYQNNAGMIFKTMSRKGSIYHPELTLHVYGEIKTGEVQMYDDWNNIYHHGEPRQIHMVGATIVLHTSTNI